TLLRQATWEGRIHEAFHWLDEMKKNPDISPQTLLTEEAQIRYAARDLSSAEQLAAQASLYGDTHDLDALKSAIDDQKRYVWNPSFVYQEDNRTRKDWVFHQTLSTWARGDARWILHHVRGSYQEQGTPDVTQNAVGLGSAIRLGLFHTL